MAAVGTLITTMRHSVMTCPACAKPVEADVAFKLSPAADGDFIQLGDHKQLPLAGELIGLSISHDCRPGAKRGPGRPRGSVAKPKPEAAPEVGKPELAPEEHREVLKERAVRDNPQA